MVHLQELCDPSFWPELVHYFQNLHNLTGLSPTIPKKSAIFSWKLAEMAENERKYTMLSMVHFQELFDPKLILSVISIYIIYWRWTCSQRYEHGIGGGSDNTVTRPWRQLLSKEIPLNGRKSRNNKNPTKAFVSNAFWVYDRHNKKESCKRSQQKPFQHPHLLFKPSAHWNSCKS